MQPWTILILQPHFHFPSTFPAQISVTLHEQKLNAPKNKEQRVRSSQGGVSLKPQIFPEVIHSVRSHADGPSPVPRSVNVLQAFEDEEHAVTYIPFPEVTVETVEQVLLEEGVESCGCCEMAPRTIFCRECKLHFCDDCERQLHQEPKSSRHQRHVICSPAYTFPEVETTTCPKPGCQPPSELNVEVFPGVPRLQHQTGAFVGLETRFKSNEVCALCEHEDSCATVKCHQCGFNFCEPCAKVAFTSDIMLITCALFVGIS